MPARAWATRVTSSVVWATELSLGWEIKPGSMAAALVRSELALFTAVVDVLPGSTPDRVVVVHAGPARPDAWRAELCEGGILPEAWETVEDERPASAGDE